MCVCVQPEGGGHTGMRTFMSVVVCVLCVQEEASDFTQAS